MLKYNAAFANSCTCTQLYNDLSDEILVKEIKSQLSDMFLDTFFDNPIIVSGSWLFMMMNNIKTQPGDQWYSHDYDFFADMYNDAFQQIVLDNLSPQVVEHMFDQYTKTNTFHNVCYLRTKKGYGEINGIFLRKKYFCPRIESVNYEALSISFLKWRATFLKDPVGFNQPLHTFVYHSFDIDILANSFDGKRLFVGDGSLLARDNIVLRRATIVPNNINPRTIHSRYNKYKLRGFNFTQDLDQLKQLYNIAYNKAIKHFTQ